MGTMRIGKKSVCWLTFIVAVLAVVASVVPGVVLNHVAQAAAFDASPEQTKATTKPQSWRAQSAQPSGRSMQPRDVPACTTASSDGPGFIWTLGPETSGETTDCVLHVTGLTADSASTTEHGPASNTDKPWAAYASAITRISIDNPTRVGAAFDGNNLFAAMPNLTAIDNLANLDTSGVTGMGGMFQNDSSLTALDLSNFNTSHVVSMAFMFDGDLSLTALDLSSFDTGDVTDMNHMFNMPDPHRDAFYNQFSKLRSITIDPAKFTTAKVEHMNYMFANCANLTGFDFSGFDTSHVQEMTSMFDEDGGLTGTLDLSSFDSTNVTNTETMFRGCSGLANIKFGPAFTLEHATAIDNTFIACSGLTDVDISMFNPVKATTVSGLFSSCTGLKTVKFSKPFSTPNATDFGWMFNGCTDLETIDIASFDVSHATTMSHMFSGCTHLTNVDLKGLTNPQVTDMSYMFQGCTAMTALDMTGFLTPSVTTMTHMFDGCNKLTDLNMPDFTNEAVTDMSYMFQDCSSMTTFDFTHFRTAAVTTMEGMFQGCTSMTDVDITTFVTSNLVNAKAMFKGCSALTGGADGFSLSTFDTTKLQDVTSMFEGCGELKKLDLHGFNTISLTLMSCLFKDCQKLETVLLPSVFNQETYADTPNLNTEHVTNMSAMFENDYALTDSGLSDIHLDHFNTSSVTNMSNMFGSCRSLQTLDLHTFDTSNVTDMTYMFQNDESLTSLNVKGFDTAKVNTMEYMFENCRVLPFLDLSTFDTRNVGGMKNMLKMDGLKKIVVGPNFVVPSGDFWRHSDMYPGYTSSVRQWVQADHITPGQDPWAGDWPDMMHDTENAPTKDSAQFAPRTEPTTYEYRYFATVDFSANADGATGSVASVRQLPGLSIKAPENGFTVSGTTFKSWNTKADGRGQSVPAGVSFTVPVPADGSSMTNTDAHVTLYGQWNVMVGTLPTTGSPMLRIIAVAVLVIALLAALAAGLALWARRRRSAMRGR